MKPEEIEAKLEEHEIRIRTIEKRMDLLVPSDVDPINQFTGQLLNSPEFLEQAKDYSLSFMKKLAQNLKEENDKDGESRKPK